MITKYYKCTLKGAIVLNASLATEGNMQTLDYIPGSAFRGILGKKYNQISADLRSDVFHSGKVSFGNAYISKDDAITYPLPVSFFTDKLKNNLVNDPIYVNHYLKDEHHKVFKESNPPIQIKQVRKGFFDLDGFYFKNIEKQFSLKSAFDRKERRSADGKMFGFDALKKGQEFVFSIIYDSEALKTVVEENLIGNRFIGKSKSAEFGSVCIKELKNTNKLKPISSQEKDSEELLTVYAASNLCFFDDLGQPTFQPSAKQFGVDGEIDWKKSQIRTYSYSPYNSKRMNSDAQRDCISKGSVFVFTKESKVLDINCLQVGAYQSEGLGRIFYNPDFLKAGKDAKSVIKLKQKETKTEESSHSNDPKSAIGKFLKFKYDEKEKEKKIAEVINEVLNRKEFLKISPSQWGGIRSIATRAENYEEMYEKLFNETTGFLMHGVASEKYWYPNNWRKKKSFETIVVENQTLGTDFVTKLAAELAKASKK